MIASCGFEVKFHDWDTCNCVGSYMPPSESISTSFYDISWSSEGTVLAAVPIAGRSVLIKPHFSTMFRNDPTLVTKEIIDISSVKCARFSRTENHFLALGTAAGHVLQYNTNTTSASILIDDLPACVNFIEYGVGDKYMVAGCSNGQVFLLQAGVGITASYFVPHSETLTALAVHPCIRQYLAGGSDKGVIAIWDVDTSCCIMKATQHEGVVEDIAFAPNDEIFTTIGREKKIHIYDLRTASCVHEKQFDVRLTTLAYCPNGNDVAVASDRGYILCLDKRYLKTTRTGLKAHDSPIKKIKFQKEVHESTLMTMQDRDYSIYPQREHDVRVSRSELKISASGDYSARCLSPRVANSACVRAAPNLQQTVANSISNYGNEYDREVPDLSLFHIIDEASLKRLREEVKDKTREIITKLMENMNTEFLKMRMSVSREFCTMEMRNKTRWQDFNDTLIKLACLDDRRHEEEMLGMQNDPNEAAVRDTRIQDSQTEVPAISEDNTYGEVAGAYSERTNERGADTEAEDTDYLLENEMVDMPSKPLPKRTSQVTSAAAAAASHHSTKDPKRKPHFKSRLPRQKTSLHEKKSHAEDNV